MVQVLNEITKKVLRKGVEQNRNLDCKGNGSNRRCKRFKLKPIGDWGGCQRGSGFFIADMKTVTIFSGTWYSTSPWGLRISHGSITVPHTSHPTTGEHSRWSGQIKNFGLTVSDTQFLWFTKNVRILKQEVCILNIGAAVWYRQSRRRWNPDFRFNLVTRADARCGEQSTGKQMSKSYVISVLDCCPGIADDVLVQCWMRTHKQLVLILTSLDSRLMSDVACSEVLTS